MGRLGQVVEDKESIQLKDLTSVSYGLAGLGEEAKGEHNVVPKARISGTGQPRNAGDKTWGLSPIPPHVIVLPTLQESLTTTNYRWWRARGRKHTLSLLPCPDSPSLCRRMCNSCKACWAVSCRPCSVSLLSAGPRIRWWPWPVPLTSSEEICESGWGDVEQEVS